MGFPKPVRAQNPDFIKKIKKLPCFSCGMKPVDPAHIRSRGAGGGDEPDNVIPLCRACHSEQHQMGLKAFAEMNGLPIDFSSIYPKLRFEWQL